MNKNQEILYKALETLSCAILTLEDAREVVKKLSKKEVEEVIENFSEKITEFDIKELYNDSYSYEVYANTILAGMSAILELDS